ncbi:hypothetical protein Pfo_022392, partial [Paulownia fortunei]
MYASPPPPHYAMLEGSQYYGSGAHPPAYHRNVPRYPSNNHKNSGGGSCCRCICCCCCFLFLLIIIQVTIFFILYHIYDPKIPTYKVEGLEVKSFDILPDFSLNTEFQLTVRADNPNRKIGFIYGDDSWVIVTYSDANLCSGKVPAFHQGHENTTIMKIDLKGKSEFGSGLQQALTDSRHSHKIPLLVKLKVPVSVVMGDIPLREFKVFVNCSLLLDNLSPHKNVLGMLGMSPSSFID